MRHPTSTVEGPEIMRRLSTEPSYVSRSLARRFAILAAAGFVVLTVSWTASWLFLPVGVLRGRTAAAVLGGDAASSFATEWLHILAINTAVVLVAVVAPNLLRTVRGYPLGAMCALLLTTVFGIMLGTNSFSIPYGDGTKIAPTIEVMGGAGVYELTSYLLAAAVTAGIGVWQLGGRWPRQTVTRVPRQPFRREEAIGAVLVIALLLGAAAWEAHRISG